MPLIRFQTAVAVEQKQAEELCAALSKVTAEVIGKPEAYVMAIVDAVPAGRVMLMAGERGAAAFVEVRSIGGLGAKVNKALSARVCELAEAKLGIAPDRVYLNFTDIPAGSWGHDGATFG